MHLHNVRPQTASDPNYDNETFRARHGYKELHVHNAPNRRSRDFKPMGYGALIGLPNFKNSEPFQLSKNMKDIWQENDSFGIKYFKTFLRGGLIGSVLGYSYFLVSPQGMIEAGKLEAAAGNRAWSGRLLRMLKSVCGRYALYGGVTFAAYHIMIE